MTRGLLLGAVLVGLPTSALAADVHVDGDGTCDAPDGSEACPYRALLPAAQAVQAGDTIVVHESAAPYGELQVNDQQASSGTADARIVLRAADDETPVVAGQVKINGLSYWTIEGLTIAGGDKRGIEVRSQAVETRGVIVRNNRVFDVQASGINSGVAFGGRDGDMEATEGTRIEGNFVFGSGGAGIETIHGSGVVVVDNVVGDDRCASATLKERGLVILTGGTEVRNNVVRMSERCDEPRDVVGIELVGAQNSTVSQNLVEIESSPMASFSAGISVRGLPDEQVEIFDNVVRGPRDCGLCDAADGDAATTTLWRHNTVVGAEVGIATGISTDAVFDSNLILATDVAVDISADTTGLSSRNNVLFAPGPDGFRVAGQPVDFEGWQAACGGCDQGSSSDEPPLAVDGLTPIAGLALDAAASDSLREAITGQAADIGALEAPLFAGADVSDDGLRVDVAFEVAQPPLDPGNCEGFTVFADDQPVGIVACEQAAGAFTLELVEPLFSDQAARLEIGSLTDRANVGGIGAMTQARSVALDTTHLEETPAEGTTSDFDDETTTTAGDSETGDDAAADASPPPPHGCGCRNQNADGAWIVMLLALISLGSIRRR